MQMRSSGWSDHTSPGLSKSAGRGIALWAGIGWSWAFSLLVTRNHVVSTYYVSATAPPAWGLFILEDSWLISIILLGTAIACACAYLSDSAGQICPRPTAWLLAAYTIPALDVIRLAGWNISHSFLEPLLLASVTGAAAAALARASPTFVDRFRRISAPMLLVVVWLLTLAAAGWWFWQGLWAYQNYLLGYHDFGHFARRVVNTWEGRGFLMESPGVPRFWDHFNPGLVLLTPLWGLWPDARLFILLQAACLSLPAPMIYGIVRCYGGSFLTATAWAIAYLLHPAVGQLNLNHSFGWHPVSLALPLLIAAILALLRGRLWAAAAAACLACSVEETVLVVTACLSFVLAAQAWWSQRRMNLTALPPPAISLLSYKLPAQGWLTIGLALTVAFLLVYQFAGFAEFQTTRFSYLGESTLEIVLSPLLAAPTFWSEIFKPRSGLYLLALLVPLGFRSAFRGWPILFAVALPVAVLLAWPRHPPATSIAFQYHTTLLPILYLAAIAGAAHARASRLADQAMAGTTHLTPLLTAGITALIVSATAATFLGAVPWSRPTWIQTNSRHFVDDDRINAGRIARMNEIVALVGSTDSRVLASGRIAAHLLHVRTLEPVGEVNQRWAHFAREVGPGHSSVELFDWIVLDTTESTQQTLSSMTFVIEQAAVAGYEMAENNDYGIVVLSRPVGRPPPTGKPLSRPEDNRRQGNDKK